MPADRWLILGAVLLYLLSLFLPAIDGTGFPALSGLDVLRQGAGAWRNGVFAWYANPLMAVTLITCWLRHYRLGLAFAVAALLLGLSSFSAGWAAETSGRSVPAFGFAAGFYVWLGAFVVAIAAAVIGYIRSRNALGHRHAASGAGRMR
jgi:hypothetical protein